MDIRIEVVPPISCLAARHVGSYGEIDEAFQRLSDIVTPSGISMADTLAVYYSDESSTPEEELQSDACVVLPIGSGAQLGGLNKIDIAGGKYAIGKHAGPYSGLAETWEYFVNEVTTTQNLQLDDRPSMERYVTISDDPTQNVTDLYLAVL